MSKNSPTPVANVDDQASFYLARIKQIDQIVEGPAKTLIGMANQGGIPTWFSPDLEPIKEDSRLTQAVCCATLQRVWRFRRRFSWLDKQSMDQLHNVRKKLVDSFAPKRHGFDQCARILESNTFGGLNPLTASQVFRILLNAGESYAHSGIGFLAFFAIIWPLSRRFPSQLTVGARIEPWDVTAYVTAKCLLPIRELQGIIEQRAKLYDDIADNLDKLSKRKRNPNRDNPRNRWLFNIELDDLSANLSHLSQLSIDRTAFQKCAESIRKLSTTDDLKDTYNTVLEHLRDALKQIRETSKQVLEDASDIVDKIRTKIEQPLRTNQRKSQRAGKTPVLATSLNKSPLKLRFSNEHIRNADYWKDLADAAKTSAGFCDTALEELKVACKICPDTSGKRPTVLKLQTAIMKALKNLASANRKVKDVLNRPVQQAALWCRSALDREIAHASAQNFTEFDPSELVSAIAVAVGWNLMSTPLQVSDAVTKAIAGARKDGSWRSGKPFYSPDHAFGIWAATSDIVCTLTNAIEQFPGVREADHEFFNFVDWLERTQIKLPASTVLKNAGTKSNAAGRVKQLSSEYVGWASERLRDRRTIHFGTTAFSINALLQVRDLAEYRLWELCEKRFSALSIDKSLRQVDPVDLGARHSERLHRRLEQMAYRAKNNDPVAEYSLVLHGPPGSSKTKLAETLSTEMWKFTNTWGPKESRLIRITPADFTRMGEDRLDSEARAIFDLITGVRAVTVFFDEIDDLLRQRNIDDQRPQFMDLVVPAMLNRLADLRSACPRQELCFVLATNYVENIDSALIRKGRIDASLPVVYPDFISRMAIGISQLNDKLTSPQLKRKEIVKCYRQLASKTAGWPYLPILSLCRSLSSQLKGSRRSFKNALDEGVAEYGSSFSLPAYQQRWRSVKRYSQELLNEYLQHLISEPENAKDCHATFCDKKEIRQRISELSLGIENVPISEREKDAMLRMEKELDAMLRMIVRKEGRVGRRQSSSWPFS